MHRLEASYHHHQGTSEYFIQNPYSIKGAGVGCSRMSEEEPIVRPHVNDVLMGRGGKNNQHSGNEKLREMARVESDNYRKSSKKGKSQISRQLVYQVRSLDPPGRFLKRDPDNGKWEDVGDDIAREKASQVLRDAVALLPEENESAPDPLPVESAQSSRFLALPTSGPVRTSESSRVQAPYIQRTAPMLTQQSLELPAPSPVASYRKRRRQHYYGYEQYSQEETHPSVIPFPTRRRYTQQPGEQPQTYTSYAPAAYARQTVHSPIQPFRPRSSYYGAYSGAAPLEPTLPRSHSEQSQSPYHQQTNRPPAISARQSSNASAQSLLGELLSGTNDFDLFNGELIESDQEEQKHSRASPRDAF